MPGPADRAEFVDQLQPDLIPQAAAFRSRERVQLQRAVAAHHGRGHDPVIGDVDLHLAPRVRRNPEAAQVDALTRRKRVGDVPRALARGLLLVPGGEVILVPRRLVFRQLALCELVFFELVLGQAILGGLPVSSVLSAAAPTTEHESPSFTSPAARRSGRRP
jgi:hypothetical protein